jgi:ABC-type multidrug transport system ATPase subunit
MTTLISCNNVNKRFAAKNALDNVSFELNAGSPVALIGPNGAGKTTLFSILCGYFKADSGTVSLLGEVPGSPRLFGRVSALPQDAELDPDMPIVKQLRFFGQLQGLAKCEAKEEAERVLTLLGLADAKQKKPGQLSHGMRKRACIAQAIMGKPELALLDEPTAGLDPANAKVIREQIMALSGETTFIVSSHNLQELERICQRVLYLADGKLSELSLVEERVESTVEQVAGQAGEAQKVAYLTLLVNSSDGEKAEQLLLKHEAVSEITLSQGGELLLQYDGRTGFDVEVLQLLAANGIAYRQLINGKTLEAKLF